MEAQLQGVRAKEEGEEDGEDGGEASQAARPDWDRRERPLLSCLAGSLSQRLFALGVSLAGPRTEFVGEAWGKL